MPLTEVDDSMPPADQVVAHTTRTTVARALVVTQATEGRRARSASDSASTRAVAAAGTRTASKPGNANPASGASAWNAAAPIASQRPPPLRRAPRSIASGGGG